jgi:predicted Zn-dependent peptidase
MRRTKMSKNTPVRSLIKSDLLCEEYTLFSHPSGLKIYVFPKKLTTTYAVMGVGYGSIYNRFSPDGSGEMITVPDGIAHFLEHKLFTNEDGSDSFERFAEYGADANAYTSFNKTAYLFSCTDNCAQALGELIDFVTHPYFTDESVASEIGIIAEEIKMYDDSPSDRCFYGMLEGMYEHHSIRRNICGSVGSISKITKETLYDCYNAFYNLGNMALIVCGDVDPDDILSIANAHLPLTSPEFLTVADNENNSESDKVFLPYVEQRMQVAKPIFNIGIKDVSIPSDPDERLKKDAAMAILDEMIFSRAGKLYNDLFERDIISPHFSYGYSINKSVAYNSIAGEADDPKLVLKEIMLYIDRLRQEGLSEEDFLRGKRVMYSEFVKSFDSTDNIANNLLAFFCEDGELLSYAEIIESVTFEDVCELFEDSFYPERITLSVVKPLKNL